MNTKIFIETERLILREWRESDYLPFAEINRNSNVMKFFPAPLTVEESEKLVERIKTECKEYGYGVFAVEIKTSGEFIGYVGFHKFGFEAPFSPGWEICWRLSDKYWNRGFATEAACACLNYARENHLFDRVYSFTAIPNKPSETVMKKIGMALVGTFLHPALPEGHWLKEHVLYQIDL